MQVLHAEEVEDQIPPERHGGHLQAEEHMECEDQVQLNPERQGDHMYAAEGPTQYRKAWSSPACGGKG